MIEKFTTDVIDKIVCEVKKKKNLEEEKKKKKEKEKNSSLIFFNFILVK